MEDPNMSAHNYSHEIFDKEAKKYARKKIAYSTNGAWKTGCLHAEE